MPSHRGCGRTSTCCSATSSTRRRSGQGRARVRDVARELARHPRRGRGARQPRLARRRAGDAAGRCGTPACRLLENEAAELRAGPVGGGHGGPAPSPRRISRAALRPVPEDAAVLLCTHDPDLFPRVPRARGPDRRGPCPRRPGQRPDPAPRGPTDALRRPLPSRPRGRGRAASLRVGRPRHRRAAAAPAPAARDSRPASHSRRAQRSSRVTCAARSPLAGSVRTSSVGPRRAPAQASQVASKSSSIHATGRSAPARASIAASFQWRAGPLRTVEAQVRPAAREPEQPRQVLLGPLLPARAPDALERRGEPRQQRAGLV